MEIGDGIWPVAAVAVFAMVALAFAAAAKWRRRENVSREEPPKAQDSKAESNRLRDELGRLHTAGRPHELLRKLDQSLPEWVVAASLIETVRELQNLDEAIVHARQHGVSDEVTNRLTLQSESVAVDLWSVAERIVVADHIGSQGLREQLGQHDAALVRLLGGIREARDDLAKLSLSDVAGWDDLRLAEGRFRSLAATARELHDWELEQAPW